MFCVWCSSFVGVCVLVFVLVLVGVCDLCRGLCSCFCWSLSSSSFV